MEGPATSKGDSGPCPGYSRHFLTTKPMARLAGADMGRETTLSPKSEPKTPWLMKHLWLTKSHTTKIMEHWYPMLTTMYHSWTLPILGTYHRLMVSSLRRRIVWFWTSPIPLKDLRTWIILNRARELFLVLTRPSTSMTRYINSGLTWLINIFSPSQMKCTFHLRRKEYFILRSIYYDLIKTLEN